MIVAVRGCGKGRSNGGKKGKGKRREGGRGMGGKEERRVQEGQERGRE